MPIPEPRLLREIEHNSLGRNAGKTYLELLAEHPEMRAIDALLERTRVDLNWIIGPEVGRNGNLVQQWVDFYKDHVSGSCDLAWDYRMFARGQGPYVWTENGDRYLDGSAGIATMNLGHRNPQVLRYEIMQKLLYPGAAPGDIGFPPYAELAKALTDRMPGKTPKRAELFNSGTEANECALKYAMLHTGKQSFLALDRAFHGRTLGSLALCTSNPRNIRGYPKAFPMETVPFPTAEHAAQETLDSIRKTLKNREQEFAGIVVEAMQGEGGYRPLPKGFLKQLRDVCDDHGTLLMIDEVQTGMGRMGTLVCHEQEGIEPDIVTLGKGLGNGSPLSAAIGKSDIFNVPAGVHGNTNGGITAVSGLAVLDQMKPGILQNCQNTGAFIREQLSQVLRDIQGFGNVRGLGMMNGFDVATPEQRTAFIAAAAKRGLLLLTSGTNTVRVIPPITITLEEADSIVEIIEKTARSVQK